MADGYRDKYVLIVGKRFIKKQLFDNKKYKGKA